MRVIKFRGKRIDNGEWVEGDLLHFPEGEIHVIPFDAVDFEDEYHVHPETVGQFTGLNDKDGKEIWEGDILVSKFGENTPKNIKFGEFMPDDSEADLCTFAGFYWDENKDRKTPFGKSIEGNTNHVTVIGNIHDNKDLL